MITYEAIFDETKTDGVFGISLVENPAMEGLFVALNKEQHITFKEVNKEQRILMGLVLEPNKPVYRNQNNEEFQIVFNEETIKNLSYNFFKAGYHKNSTIEHSDRIEGVTFVESWLVEDPKKDKSNVYGFSYPKGSWVATMKVDSDDVWNNFVKTGKVQGFSIDAMINLKEINLKSDLQMAEEKEKELTLLQKIEALFNKNEKAEEKAVDVKLAMIKTTDGQELHYDGETLTAGIAVWLLTPEQEKVALPVGEYDTEEGVVVVTEEGVIAEVKSKVDEAPEEAPMSADAPSQESELEKAIKSILVKYKSDIDEKLESFKAEFSKKDEVINELKKEVLELSKEPVKKVVKTPTQATGKKLSLTERLNNKL